MTHFNIGKNISLYFGNQRISWKSHEICVLENISGFFSGLLLLQASECLLILLPIISYTNVELILLPLLIWKVNLSTNGTRVWAETYGENTCSGSMKSYEVEVKNVSSVGEEKVNEKFVPVSNIFSSQSRLDNVLPRSGSWKCVSSDWTLGSWGGFLVGILIFPSDVLNCKYSDKELHTFKKPPEFCKLL